MPRHQTLRDLLFGQSLEFLFHSLRRCENFLTSPELVSELLKPVPKVAQTKLVCQRSAVALLDILSHLIKCVD